MVERFNKLSISWGPLTGEALLSEFAFKISVEVVDDSIAEVVLIVFDVDLGTGGAEKIRNGSSFHTGLSGIDTASVAAGVGVAVGAIAVVAAAAAAAAAAAVIAVVVPDFVSAVVVVVAVVAAAVVA